MYNDIYSKISTPLGFADNLAKKHHNDDMKRFGRRHKQKLVTPQDKVAYIKQEYERRRLERLWFELKWQLNMAFLEGEQYQYISSVTNDLVEYPKMFTSQEREAYNHILPIYTTRLAKLSRLHIVFKARPATSDSDDVNNAHITTKLLEQWQNDTKLSKLQSQANEWSECTGTAVWKTIWNPNKGRKLTENADGTFLYEGEVENVVCSPFEIFPDSSYNADVEYCKSIIHARAVDVDYIYDNFGVDLAGKKLNVFSSGLNTLRSGNGNRRMLGSDTQEKDNVIMLYEYYEVPSKEHPNGVFWIACDDHDELLYEGELPFVNDKYNTRTLPFDVQRSVERPGYFWGKSMIDSLIPVQRRYNAIKNRTAEYLNRVAVGVTIVDTHTADMNNLEENGINPGDIIFYEPTEGAQIPTYMQTPGLPNKFYEQENMELQNFTKMSGVSEISRDSSAPTGIESGKALTILNEQDETRLSLTARQIQDCMLGVATKTVYAYKQFANNQRLMRIVGQSDAIKLMAWDKNSLTAEDICVEGIARISETLTQKRNFVLEMIQLGLFRDENGMIDTENILEMVEFGDVNIDRDSKRLQKIKSNEENVSMSLTGQPAAVEFYENHIVAMETHRAFMLSTEFSLLDPQKQKVIKEHFMQHNAIQQQLAMQQAQMMQAQAPADNANGPPKQGVTQHRERDV